MSLLSPISSQTGSNPATHPKLNPDQVKQLDLKIAQATSLLNEIAKEFSPAVFANSLGAEDMVLTDLILRQKIDLDIFSLDTGRLPPETYTLMAAMEKHYGTRLTLYFPEHTALESYVKLNGINGFYNTVELRKTCCRIRKVEPLGRALQGKKAWITGMRAQQSSTRNNLPLRSFDADHGLEKFNPLTDWSEQEVWAYLRRHKVPYNSLHDQFYPSIGCAPCSRAVSLGEDIRAGRWWWENPDSRECGLHLKTHT